jgi:hypothetical protein
LSSEQVGQVLHGVMKRGALLGAQRGERLAEALVAGSPQTVQELRTARRDAHAVEAAVFRVGVSLEEALLDEAIDDARDRRQPNAEAAGDLAVADAGREAGPC